LSLAESLRRPGPVALWGLIGLMSLSWGLNPIIGKVALRDFPPLAMVGLRTSLAALVILPIFFAQGGPARAIRPGDWPRLLGIGVLQVGNQTLFLSGLGYTSVAHCAFLFSLTPIMVLLMAAALGQERIGIRKLAGMSICLAGVMLLSQDEGDASAAPTFFGDALVFAATISFSAFTVFSKSERSRYGSVALNTIAYCFGALYQPVLWGVYSDFNYAAVPWQAWAGVAYMGTLPAVAGYLIYQWALGHAPASKIAVLQYVQPPLVATLGFVLLGEALTGMLAAAGALILVGVILAETARK
jgi:drug/metabolite transporter (DMT)-like permease